MRLPALPSAISALPALAAPLAALLVLGLAAGCSRPAASTDCPPAQTQGDQAQGAGDSAQAQGADPSTDGGEAAAKSGLSVPDAPETVALSADDGHALNLWVLAPEGEDRPAILLVHGRTWSSAPDFDLRVDGDPSASLAHRLAQAGYAVYGVDLRGYGKSARDESGWIDPERASEDLYAALKLIAEREGEAPDLLGWSMGALVSHLTVQRHPEAAHKLVLYGYPRDIDARYPPSDPKAEPKRAPTTAEAAASDFLIPGSISKEAIQAFVDASLAADPVRADWRNFDQLHQLDAAAITQPTLVIHGARDPIATQLRQAKLFTRLKVEERAWLTLPGADHAAHLEHPEAFTRAVLAFLAP